MKDGLKDDVFQNLTAAHKRLWESLSTVLPRFQPPTQNVDLRQTYLNNLAHWEAAVKQTLQAESAWLEQWSKQITSNQNTPEFMTGWLQQIEEVMQHWIRTQTQLWEDCFGMLKEGNSAARPAGESKTVAAVKGPMEIIPPQSEPSKAALERKPADKSPTKDDLKTISGLGPALEKRLNAYGIVSYRQLAELTDEQIKHLETAVIKHSGRISRDKWIEQAKEQHYKKYNERL